MRITTVKRQTRVRAKARAVSNRPRLHIFRSLKFISLQVIDDKTGKTLAAVHEKKVAGKTKAERLAKLGEEIAAKSKAAGVVEVYFDRGPYAYHGNVALVADAARKGGLKF